jgi:hypothetical protein
MLIREHLRESNISKTKNERNGSAEKFTWTSSERRQSRACHTTSHILHSAINPKSVKKHADVELRGSFTPVGLDC